MPVFWWMRLDLVFLVGMSTYDGVFWGISGLIMILGSLSATGWGCLPVLLVVWHMVSSTVACSLLSELGLGVEMEISGRFSLVLHGAGRSLVDQCSEVGSPTSEALP